MNQVKSDKVVFYSLIIGAMELAVWTGALVWFIKRLPPEFPVLYSMPWGEDQLVSSQIFMLLPLVGLAILVVNTLFAKRFLESEKLVARIIVAGGTLAVTLLATTAVKILWLTHF